MAIMVNIRSCLAIGICMALAIACADHKLQAQTPILRPSEPVERVDTKAREVLDQHLRFRGRSDNLTTAIENLRSVRTLRMEGTITEGPVTYTVTASLEFPARIRLDTIRENMDWVIRTRTIVTASNAFSQQLAPRKEDVRSIPAIETTTPKNYLDYAAPLWEWQDKNHSFQHRGEVMLGKQRAVLLRATLENGGTRYYYFHPETHHLMCVGLIDMVDGKLVETDWLPSKISRVGNIHIETGWVCSVKGKEYRKIEWTTTTLNPIFDSDLFE